MNAHYISDEDLESYLLGDMPPPARSALEDRYLSDDGIYERLLAIEDELIDHQVHGLLSTSQRACLKEQLLLSEDGLERLKFAQALAQLHLHRRRRLPRRVADGLPQWSNRGALYPSAIGAMVLLAFAIFWRDFRTESVRPQAMTQTAPRADHAPSSSVTLLLRSVSRDKSAGNILRVPGGHAHVFLEAQIAGDIKNSYHVTLQHSDSATIETPANVTTRASQSGTIVISADFSSESLKEGDYILTVSMETGQHSSEEIIAYALSVIRTTS